MARALGDFDSGATAVKLHSDDETLSGCVSGNGGTLVPSHGSGTSSLMKEAANVAL